MRISRGRAWETKKTGKAIATHTLFLIIVMVLFAIVAFILFGGWLPNADRQANKATCTYKKISYCTDWKANSYTEEPWDWYDKNPEGCETLDPPIFKPRSLYECETLLGS